MAPISRTNARRTPIEQANDLIDVSQGFLELAAAITIIERHLNDYEAAVAYALEMLHESSTSIAPSLQTAVLAPVTVSFQSQPRSSHLQTFQFPRPAENHAEAIAALEQLKRRVSLTLKISDTIEQADVSKNIGLGIKLESASEATKPDSGKVPRNVHTHPGTSKDPIDLVSRESSHDSLFVTPNSTPQSVISPRGQKSHDASEDVSRSGSQSSNQHTPKSGSTVGPKPKMNARHRAYRAVYNRMWEAHKLPYQEDWDEVMAADVNIKTLFRHLKAVKERIEAEAIEQGIAPDFTFPRRPPAKKGQASDSSLRTYAYLPPTNPSTKDASHGNEDSEETSDDDSLNGPPEDEASGDVVNEDSEEDIARKDKGKQKDDTNEDSDSDDDDDDDDHNAGDHKIAYSKEETASDLTNLRGFFPTLDPEHCKAELQVQSGNIALAIKQLEKETKEDSQGKSVENKRNLLQAFDEALVSPLGPKKARFDSQYNGESSVSRAGSGSKIKQTQHYDPNDLKVGGIRAILDSEEYPTKLPKSVLNNIGTLREELKTVDENDPDASIRVPGVEPDIFHAVMIFLQSRKLKLNCGNKSEELHAMIKMAIFGADMRAELGIFGAFEGSVILAAFKKILVDETDPTTLQYKDVQLIYNKLHPGHPLREICVQAAYKPWMGFHYHHDDDPNAPDSGSESEVKYRDAAHRIAFQTSRPPFYKMLLGPHTIQEFRDEFFLFQARNWHTRVGPILGNPRVRNKNGPVDIQRVTRVLDPLTDSLFVV